ncbi:MAG: hypothetical protein IIC24_07290 [Chloroflexi bacterium]|nr:hypothetical protein [Chloroflexota bacterium]
MLVVGPDGGECERIVQAANAGLTVMLDEMDIADAGHVVTVDKPYEFIDAVSAYLSVEPAKTT